MCDFRHSLPTLFRIKPFAMEDEILIDSFVLELAEAVDEEGIAATTLATFLGLKKAVGKNATVMGLVMQHLEEATSDVIYKYRSKHGKRKEGALKLRSIFVKKELDAPATLLEKELDKHKIEYPSRADILIGETPSLPSTPQNEPGKGAEASAATGSGTKTAIAVKDPAHKDDEPTEEPMQH